MPTPRYAVIFFVGPDGEVDESTAKIFNNTVEGARAMRAYILSEKRKDMEASDAKPMDYGIPSSNWSKCSDFEIEDVWEIYFKGCSWEVL